MPLTVPQQSPPPAPLTRQAEPRPVQVAHGWDRDLPRAGRTDLGTAPRLGGHHHLVDGPIVEASRHPVDLCQLQGRGAGCEGAEAAPLHGPPWPGSRTPGLPAHGGVPPVSTCTLARTRFPATCTWLLLPPRLDGSALGWRTPGSRAAVSRQPLLGTGPALTAPGSSVPAVLWPQQRPHSSLQKALGLPENGPKARAFSQQPLDKRPWTEAKLPCTLVSCGRLPCDLCLDSGRWPARGSPQGGG